MDWKIAFKIVGPSALAAWVFTNLISSYLETSEIIKTNLYLNFGLLFIIFLFCVVMGWLWIRAGSTKSREKGKVKDNKVFDNEIEKDMEIGSEHSEILNNEVERNKVKGSMKIGGK